MSAVLGPIHEWMYNKVIVQENLISGIVKLADESEWNHSIIAIESFPTLEETIDLSNIHGSLFGMIDETETRYAKLVSELIKEDMGRCCDIEKMVTSCGVSIALQPQTSAVNTYQQLEGYLLDGMPCDHAMRICESSDSRVEVMRTMDTHSAYWENVGLTGDIYYNLRGKFVAGLLSKSGFCCRETEAGIYEIVPLCN